MVRRRERGFTLMEVVISLALFGVFLFIIGQLTSEMRYYEKRYPVNFMAHPQVNAVIARLRKDVYDSTEYPETYETYTMGKQTLILETLQETCGLLLCEFPSLVRVPPPRDAAESGLRVKGTEPIIRGGLKGYTGRGTVIVEQLFALPGIGLYIINAIYNKDLIAVQGAVLFVATFYVVINAVVEIGYAWLDPRVKLRA